jgi:hypothetical protein
LRGVAQRVTRRRRRGSALTLRTACRGPRRFARARIIISP